MGWFSFLFGRGAAPPARRQTTRAEMDAALKALVVPRLRALGFKGTMPHFRRRRGDAFDLLTFMFSQSGGRFVVELARWPDAVLERAGKSLGPDKANTFSTWHRHRLGAGGPRGGRPRTDHWFVFEHADPEGVAGQVLAELDDPLQWEIVDALPVEGADGD